MLEEDVSCPVTTADAVVAFIMGAVLVNMLHVWAHRFDERNRR